MKLYPNWIIFLCLIQAVRKFEYKLRIPFCSKIQNLAPKFILCFYPWLSWQKGISSKLQQPSCQHWQNTLLANLHCIIQSWGMLDISNLASDSVSLSQMLFPGLLWYVPMYLLRNRWERSLGWSKVPQSLTSVMQLSWNVMSTKQKTFQSHTTWFKSSQKKGETKHLTGNLPMKWLVLIWVMPVLRALMLMCWYNINVFHYNWFSY